VTLRARVLGAGSLLVLLPLLLLTLAIRGEMARRLREQYTHRVDAMVDVVADDLAARDALLGDRLAALGRDLSRRNDVRLALQGRSDERTALLDWAGGAMELAGLDALLLEDGSGRILSSGHFRNDYDRVDGELAPFLATTGGRAALVSFRRPAESFLALARLDTLRVGGQALRLVAGIEWNGETTRALGAARDVAVSLVHGEGVLPADTALAERLRAGGGRALAAMRDSGGTLVRERELLAAPALCAPGRDHALVIVTHSLAPMNALLRSLDARLAFTWIVLAGAMLLLADRLSRGIAKPIEALARRTAAIEDLETLDVSFPTDRDDEVGTLSRFLAAMMSRLRAGVSRLQDAERRATLGELARQVNHDLKNAFTPLRNVVRHLSEVSEGAPADLPRVYAERRATLDAGLGYLEELATNWGRLSHRPEREACDVGAIVDAVTAGRREEDGGPIRVRAAADTPRAWASPVGVRRIIENLVANACDSGEDTRVTVTVAGGVDDDGPVVRITVADEGPGIPEEMRRRIFDPFVTTKPDGSGLGLSIVRRLVSDFEGTVRLESGPGEGAVFVVTLPAAGGTT
jgi:signal transduction histidine kinase